MVIIYPFPPQETKKEMGSRDGDGYDGGMDRRLTALEEDMKVVKKDLTDLKVSVASMSGKIDILIAKIPSWWQAPVGAGGLIALLAALIGLAKAPHWL
ncbi:hypothetical protein [Acetobacter sp.]|uniref:hypothetical protein n=1 Tax=Acetobacter sp. TaxID=440 RepID=UPI0039EC9905